MAFQSKFCAYIAACSKTAKGVVFLIMCALEGHQHCIIVLQKRKKGRNSIQLLSYLYAALFALARQKNF